MGEIVKSITNYFYSYFKNSILSICWLFVIVVMKSTIKPSRVWMAQIYAAKKTQKYRLSYNNKVSTLINLKENMFHPSNSTVLL